MSSGTPSQTGALSLTHCAPGLHLLWLPPHHLGLTPSPAHPFPSSPPPGAGDRCYLRPPDSSGGLYGVELLVRKISKQCRAALTWPPCPREVATRPATRQVPQVWELIRGPFPLSPDPLSVPFPSVFIPQNPCGRQLRRGYADLGANSRIDSLGSDQLCSRRAPAGALGVGPGAPSGLGEPDFPQGNIPGAYKAPQGGGGAGA